MIINSLGLSGGKNGIWRKLAAIYLQLWRLDFCLGWGPTEEYINKVKALAKNYKDNFDRIIDFILPDLREMYGDVSKEDVKNNLGKPIIDYNQGTVSYCDQTFDDWHIFEFEFLDEKFEKIEHFSVDG